jgi:hypothetical protein
LCHFAALEPVETGSRSMSPSTNSDILWSKIRLAEGRLTAASDRFWYHAQIASLYPAFLVQLHHIVSGGLDLMAFAASRSSTLRDDPAAAILAEYLRRHIEEEREHADWLLSDIAALGISESEVRATEPCASVIALLGGRYFWIAHAHPSAVFGYLIVLEGSPPLVHQLDEIQQRTQLPRAAFNCLRLHAEEDPAHLAELNCTLDAMPLSPRQSTRVALEAFATIEAVASLMDELTGDQAQASCSPVSAPLVMASSND